MSSRHPLPGRSLILALALGSLGVGLAAAGACGAASTSSESEADIDQRADKPVPERGKQWGGWRWKGTRDDCFFRYRKRCYARLPDACRAAGCSAKSACVHDDSVPAVVSCQK